MQSELQSLREEALLALQSIDTLQDLQAWKTLYMGKKGKLTKILQGMAKLSPEERPKVGQWVNRLREDFSQAEEGRRKELEQKELQDRLAKETMDLTIPGPTMPYASRHPWMLMVEEIEDFFLSIGYQVVDGPEIENDHYNFTMLNLPPEHPARAMQDSFYLQHPEKEEEGAEGKAWLLRTHTSPVQIRAMQQANGQPLRMISPGRVYRRDHDDATHTHQFGQIEGLAVGEGLTLCDLQGVLSLFLQHLFGSDVIFRIRSSYFPFTEPSIEVDIQHPTRGWIEVLGAGMVHPWILDKVGYDSEKSTGFAFGVGIERLIMLRYGVTDIRVLYENDLRLLTQWRG